MKKKIDYIGKALQNQDFCDYLKELQVKALHQQDNNGNSAVYEMFNDDLEWRDDSPYSFISEKQWSEAKEDSETADEVFEEFEDELYDNYAEAMLSEGCEFPTAYKKADIRKACEELSGWFCIPEIFQAHFGGAQYVAQFKAEKEHLTDDLVMAVEEAIA